MTDRITAASVTNLFFKTTAIAEARTDTARKQLSEKLEALKQLIATKLPNRAQDVLAKAEQGSNTHTEIVSGYLDEAMAENSDFAQQVRGLAQDIQQIIDPSDQLESQNVQNILGGVGYQINKPQAPVILGNYNIVNIKYSSRLNLGAPFQAPPLPLHYVQRPEPLEAVKTILLDKGAPGTLVISAIYGMGGIGKSVLAAALVREPEIQERFSDGILWVTLGQQPNLLPMVNLWIRELGDYDYNPTTLKAASLHLRTLLADKQALLVVDDVWHPEHVEPFRIGGAGCCVLVTTRQTQIVGAREHDLALMTPEQSLELLTKYLPNPLTDVERSQAEAFAKEVGYLPLALELAAARIKKGVFWDELLTAFQKEMTVLNLTRNVDAITDESTRKQHSLVASFKLTLKLLSPQQLEEFAWLGIVHEDVMLTQEMGATLWGVDSFESGKILRDFKDQALLLPQAQRPGARPTYRIHDLVHDLAKNLLTHKQYLGDLPGLGLTIEAAHSQFLEHYRVQTQNGIWCTVPADGYIHSHLVWHFQQSRQPELIHQLLKESTPEGRNGWYEACDQLGQTANFIIDIARAWQAAKGLYNQNATESIALQCRYALITSTFNSLTENIPPALIAACVQKGFWKPAQGLAHVRQAQESFQCANGLRKLVPYLPQSLMHEAASVARSIKDPDYRAKALFVLAHHMPEVASEALAEAHLIQDEQCRTRALIELVMHLPEGVSEALALARSIQDEYYRAEALIGLAPYVSEEMSELLAVVRSIQSGDYQAKALVGLVPYVPEVVNEAVVVARSIPNKYHQAKALIGLVPYVPEVVNEAIVIAHSIEDQYHRAKVLIGLAPYVPEVVSEAVVVARSIMSAEYRAEALIELVQYMPEVMSEALKMAHSIEDRYYQAKTLIRLAPYMPEVVSETLTLVSSLSDRLPADEAFADESSRAIAMMRLAQYVPEAFIGEALAVARSIQSGKCRALALTGLAQYVPESLISKAVAIAHSIEDESFQVKALCSLVPYVPEAVSEAVVVARSIQSGEYQAKVLCGLAEYTPEVISETLIVMDSIKDELDRLHTLRAVLKYVPKSLMGEVLTIARSFQDEYCRTEALLMLVPYLPKVVSETWVLARSIFISERRNHHAPTEFRSVAVEYLRKLANYAPELKSEARELTRHVDTPEEWRAEQQAKRDRFFKTSSPKYMPESLINEMLAMTHSIQSGAQQAKILSQLNEYVPEVVSEALAMTRSIQNEYKRAENLCRLAQKYVAEVMSKVLALEIQNESSWTEALHGLAQKYVAEVMSEVLALARSIQDESYRTKALCGLAEYVPESLMSEAVAATRSIQSKYFQAKVLHELLSKLKKLETDIAFWDEVLHTLAYQDRKSFLADIPKLTPAIISLSGEDTKALELVVEAIRDVGHQWS